jgi:hypothetical protein
MAELDPRTATETARRMLAYVQAFNGEKFSPVFDDIDRQNLATALDNLEETAAMLLNMAERATQADAAEVGQWRPIESAPKDGSEILLGRAANEELEQEAISVPGSWQAGYEDGVDYMGVDDGFVDSHYQVFSGGRSFGAESYRYAPNQPTHWMPLPAAPADSSMGGGER